MKTVTHRTKAILISSVGGGLEVYDFMIYGFFAPIIAKLFFPTQNDFFTLLNTFSIFAVGYFARPLGAIIFGHFGDKSGRKRGMLISITIMAIATMGIGLLPSYATIGVFAPVLLVFFRFLQGIAIGGDLPGAITFVSEYSENDKRGFNCSLIFCVMNFGLLLASLTGGLLTLLLTHEQLIAWGWRIAFLLGLVIGIVGFYLRNRVGETPHFTQLKQNEKIVKAPMLHLFRIQTKQILQSLGLVWLFAVIISQVFLYMPTYLNMVNHISLSNALIINSINILIYSLCIPLVGYLTDKIGRKPVILLTSLFFVCFTYPLYTLLLNPNHGLQLFSLLTLSIFSAGVMGSVPAILAEMFVTNVRYSGIAISYNIGFAIFGGLTPIIITFLMYKLNFPQAPSLNLILSAIIALLASLWMQDRKEIAINRL